ncbi:MAG: DNA-processing protein DprA [Clostridia bacterium]|nr:DNA-processing protein DprA [Clostridia bacterium]
MMLVSDLYLWLSYSRVSTSRINRILEKIPITVLWESFAESDDFNKYSLDEKTFTLLKRSRNVDFIERTKQYLADNHICYMTRVDPMFPPALSQREVDPPLVLYYKGRPEILREPCIAVVGTRRASQYGRYFVQREVSELARSFTVVSGLAAGIDGYAHSAALSVGGNTVAVLGSGLFNPSPVSNIPLFDEICKNGIVLSEYPPDVHATAYTFPQRNRIISGLCKGVLVVEAAEKSGSLITANCALEQGRDVFAVPGDVDKPRSVGTNRLIKQGAVPVTCAADITEYYGMRSRKAERQKAVALDFAEEQIMSLLEKSEMSFDMLVEKSGMTVPELNTALSSLMIYGLIHEKSKNLYCISK